MDSEQLQKAIFGLHTRRFGTVAEIMIKKIIKENLVLMENVQNENTNTSFSPLSGSK